MRTAWISAFVLPLFTFTACSTVQLPPPATPTPALAQVPPAPRPAPGVGQVVLDVPDGPAVASDIVGSYQMITMSRYGASITPQEMLQPVCTTPCVANLPYGNHQLRFTSVVDDERTSTGTVAIGPEVTGYRHALGTSRPHVGARVGGIIALSTGLSLALTGLLFALLSSSADTTYGTTSGSSSSSLGGIGIGMGVGGGILTAGGIALLAVFRAEFQPGMGIQFALPGVGGAPPPAAPPGSWPVPPTMQ